MRAPFTPKSATGLFTKDGKTIKVTAVDPSGVRYLNMLASTSWYNNEEAFDLCYKFKETYGFDIKDVSAEAEKMTIRGGKRNGAGRPPLKVKRFYITLTQEQIDWLKTQRNASKTIRILVEEKMDNQLAWETLNDYCSNTLKDLENWRGMSIEQIEATLRKYDSEVLGETMDRIDQRAKAIYKLANGIDDKY